MKKKCALAMALIHNPRVLFLDEPFEGIDPVASRSIKDLLILMSKKGITILITSHILEIVERLVTAFAVIVHGEMAVSQTMEETFQSGRSLEETYFQYVERRVVEDFEWIG
jgi:ABC-2 type transport system ATP-binding protein